MCVFLSPSLSLSAASNLCLRSGLSFQSQHCLFLKISRRGWPRVSGIGGNYGVCFSTMDSRTPQHTPPPSLPVLYVTGAGGRPWFWPPSPRSEIPGLQSLFQDTSDWIPLVSGLAVCKSKGPLAQGFLENCPNVFLWSSCVDIPCAVLSHSVMSSSLRPCGL